MSQALQPRGRLGGGPAVAQRADAHAVPRGGSGPARQHEHRKALPLHLACQFIGVRSGGKAAELYRPSMLRCRGSRNHGIRRCCGGRHRGFKRSRWCRTTKNRAGTAVSPAPAVAPASAVSPAPAAALAAVGLGVPCACGPGAGVGVIAGSGTGGLAVARSTVTLRTGSGALMGSLVPTGAVAGPDKSSGTISTMSTTRIDAPTRRSFTRRSMATASNANDSGRRSIFGIVGP